MQGDSNALFDETDNAEFGEEDPQNDDGFRNANANDLLPFDEDDDDVNAGHDAHGDDVMGAYGMPSPADQNDKQRRFSNDQNRNSKRNYDDDDKRQSVSLADVNAVGSMGQPSKSKSSKKMKRDAPAVTKKKPVSRPTTSSRRSGGYIDEGEAITRVQDFLTRMGDAAQKDEDAMARNVPATDKLKMLNEVVDEIPKPKWVQWYIQEGVVAMLDRWLNPLPNGGLPNMTLRTKLLTLLQKMNLPLDYLVESKIGFKLVSFWKSRDETNENRAIIRQLITQWVQPSMGHRMSTPQQAASPTATSKSLAVTPSPAKSNITSRLSRTGPQRATGAAMRATVPRVGPRSFAVAPQSAVPLMSHPRSEESVGFRLPKMETASRRRRC